MSFVIGRLLALNARTNGVLNGKIDPTRIAIAGHSDGAETALAVAYDHRFRDLRVRAAIVLSGAALPGMGAFPRTGPPLLAVQGTADPINAPATSARFFRLARRPKFLLWLFGASYLPPYTDAQPQLGIVEQATIAFLDHYLKEPTSCARSSSEPPGPHPIRRRPIARRSSFLHAPSGKVGAVSVSAPPELRESSPDPASRAGLAERRHRLRRRRRRRLVGVAFLILVSPAVLCTGNDASALEPAVEVRASNGSGTITTGSSTRSSTSLRLESPEGVATTPPLPRAGGANARAHTHWRPSQPSRCSLSVPADLTPWRPR
jgi:hypothetical protein